VSLPRLTELEEHKIDNHITRETGSGAVSINVSAPETGKRWALKEVRVSLNAVGASGDLTITINNGTNAVYDHVLESQDMSSVQYHRYAPTRNVPLKPTDTIDIVWANAGGKTYGIEVFTNPEY
jgi:hypothetical protein